jgi:steroid 5-alpha reductase family enzyme
MKLNQNKLNFAALSVLASLLVVFSGEAIADRQSAPFEVPPAAFEKVNLDGLRSSLRETDAIGFHNQAVAET